MTTIKPPREGTRKATIRELFKRGGEADRQIAHQRGIKSGLQPSTLRAWFYTWAREIGSSKKSAPAKAAKKKTAPRKKAPAKKTS